MKIFLAILFVCCSEWGFAQPQKIIADGTITFSIYQTINGQQTLSGSKVIYIKGKDIRTDLTTSRFSQTVFYDSREGKATVLKYIGQSKYISYYDEDEWRKQNEMFKDASMSLTGKTKTILNYVCKEALLKLADGIEYTIYFTSLLKPSVEENPYEFTDVPGLVLAYQSTGKSGIQISYIAEKIDFDPVPSAQFEIPVKGFRLLKN
jgi:GLPGLI family protein